MEGGYREKIKIATKRPPYLVKKQEDLDEIFNTQLKRLKTDYIDYYLVHMLTDTTVWNRLFPQFHRLDMQPVKGALQKV